MDDSLEQTRRNCRYHAVWAPKYRRKIIYGKYRREIGATLLGAVVVAAYFVGDAANRCRKAFGVILVWRLNIR
jgi:hypothetical protein